MWCLLVVFASGVRPDPAKVEKVRLYSVPTDATKVRQFLGLASYYRKFIPGFATIAGPLHALTKKMLHFIGPQNVKLHFNV